IHVINSTHRYKAERFASKSDYVASGTQINPIESIGTATITVRGPDGPVDLILRDVAYMPGYFTNIVSITKLETDNIYMDTRQRVLYTMKDDQPRIVAHCPRENGHFILSTRELITASAFSQLSTTSDEITQSSKRMHEAMGHLGPKALSLLPSSTTGAIFRGRGPTTVECEACALAKAKQIINRNSEKSNPVQAPFEQINIDLFSFPPDKSKYKYVLILVDSWTGFTMAYSLKLKSDTSTVIFEAIALISTQFEKKVKSIRLDNETSLMTDYFLSKIREMGIILIPSAPYTPQQNGRSERAGGEVNRRARAICIQSKLSPLLWSEIVKTSCYLLNRTPRYRLGNKTPYEILFNKQPDLSHIRPIGCKAYYLLKGPRAPPKLQKLNARAAIGYLIGYEGANKFRIWNPARDIIIITRDVTFNESIMYDPSDSIKDPLLIRDNTILSTIDEFSVCGPNSIRHPHQLADTEQDLISWTNIFDNFTSTVPSSTYEEQHIQDTFPKTQDISDIAGEDYPIPLSIDTISNDTLPSINIQETTETSQDLLTDISSSPLSSIMEQDFMDNDEN
ncbi:hypothetical protein K3495_g15175, partial [Podosphaera aphanis]